MCIRCKEPQLIEPLELSCHCFCVKDHGGTRQIHLALWEKLCKLELIIERDLLCVEFVWKCCLSWVSHSRNYCLISCCHLVVSDRSWGLPAVNICITCCHVRAWAAEECFIMKDSASFPCMCCKTGFYEGVCVQAAVALILLEGWILKSHLCLLFHFMSHSMISEF